MLCLTVASMSANIKKLNVYNNVSYYEYKISRINDVLIENNTHYYRTYHLIFYC